MENRMDPELRSTFSVLPELNLDDLHTQREMMNEMLEAPPEDSNIKVTERFIPGPADNPEVRVKIYEPVKKDGLLPGLLYIHGGGMVLGSPEMTDGVCYSYVKEVNCVIVSVQYRLAPEHPFPAGPEDCYAALKWFYDHANELGVDSSRLGVAGASAGGGLTLAVSLMTRDRQGPPLIFQMPLYPMIDDRNTTPSSHEITDKRVWCREHNLKAWDMYLGNGGNDNVSPYAAPARATDFSGLPPTFTFIGDLDPFRDETIELVAKLSQAGVPTEFTLYPGCFHGFEVFVPDADVSKRSVASMMSALKRGLHQTEATEKIK